MLEFMSILVIGPMSCSSSTIAFGKEPVVVDDYGCPLDNSFLLLCKPINRLSSSVNILGVHEEDVLFVHGRGSLDVMSSTISRFKHGSLCQG